MEKTVKIANVMEKYDNLYLKAFKRLLYTNREIKGYCTYDLLEKISKRRGDELLRIVL